jgi:long-chain acyl-CoA synthetase
LQTLNSIFDDVIRQWPNQTFLYNDEGLTTSYAELNTLSHCIALKLQQSSTQTGDRVGILSRNSPLSIATFFAIIKIGGVVVWLNHTHSAEELAFVINDSGISILLHEPVFAKKATQTIALAECRLMKIEAQPTESSSAINTSIAVSTDLACIVYTSGSTDKPLGVMLSHKNLISNNLAIAEYLSLTNADRIACVLPLYYIYGLSLLLSHLIVGGSIILDNRFLYPQQVIQTMDDLEATGFAGVSSHYHMLVNHTDFMTSPLSHLRYMQHAGDKMPPALALKIAEHFPEKQLFLMYGQTEASPRIAFLQPSKVVNKSNSAGHPIPGITLNIMDDNGQACQTGTEGEIAIQGDNVMLGYWNNATETKKVLRNGWLYTGDLAKFDADGDLLVTGRKKQFIKIGGRRVSPLEIESMTLEWKGVAEVAAIGIADEVMGSRIKVFVTESDAVKVNPDELINFYKKKLPSYMVPAEIEVLPHLPKKANGKIDRSKLV